MEGNLRSETPATSKSAPRWAQWLYKVFNDWLLVKGSRLLFVLAGIMMVVQVLTVVVDALFRRLPWPHPFHGGGLELEELQMAMLTAMMLGYTWFLRGHIRIELFREKMKPRLGAVADTFAGVCGLVYSAAVFRGILRNTLNNFSLDMRTDMLDLPIAPFQMLFTLVFLQFIFILFGYTVKSIYRIFNPPLAGEGSDD